MKRLLIVLAAVVTTLAGVVLAAPTASAMTPYCGIVWGSLNKAAGDLSPAPVVNVRAGQHPCFDRLVLDLAGSGGGYRVGYTSAVVQDGSGQIVPLRGGAFLSVVVLDPANDINTGEPTYTPARPTELVDVSGYRTFRQIVYAGSFEGQTTVGLGVRARLPFRVFVLAGPGTNSRLVIDVAHKW